MLRVGLLGVLPFMAAQSQLPEPQIFRSGTRLVEVDVVVRSKEGPVRGLTRDDFTVFDQGKRQPVAVFGSAAPPAFSAPLAPGAVSNRRDSRGRLLDGATAVLIDQLNTRFDYKAYERTQVIRFLRGLSETDRIALYSLGRDLHILQDFTADPRELIGALAKLDQGLDSLPANLDVVLEDYPSIGDAAPNCANAKGVLLMACTQTAVNAGLHDDITVEALKRIIQHLAGVPGRRNLVWVKETPQIPPAVVAMAEQANIALYPVLIRTVIVGNPIGFGPDFMATQHAVRDLAAVFGGAGFDDAADIKAAVRTAEEDSESAYTLGYYPAEETLDGKFHRIVVKVSNRELQNNAFEVRYRAGYVATKSTTPPPASTLSELLESPLNATTIGLSALATPDPSRPGSYRVRITVDLRDLHLDRGNGHFIGAIDLSFLHPATQSVITRTIRIDIAEGDLARSFEEGYVVNAIGIDGQTGQIHLAVRDRATGAAGSLRIALAR
jgi:VWFA-related protein